jgi:hypothetical protein
MSHAIERATLPSQIVFLEQFPRKTQYTQQAFVDRYVKGLEDGGAAELMAINQSEFPSAAPRSGPQQSDIRVDEGQRRQACIGRAGPIILSLLYQSSP